MNKHQRAWIRALRKPGAKQAPGAFVVTDELTEEVVGMCCLGVYCTIDHPNYLDWYGANSEQAKQDSADGTTTIDVVHHNWSDECADRLPFQMRREVGLTKQENYLLAALNDNGFTFDLIADVLEHAFEDGSIDLATATLELGYVDDQGHTIHSGPEIHSFPSYDHELENGVNL